MDTHIHTHTRTCIPKQADKSICKKILDVKSRKTRITERQGTTREGPAAGYKGDKGNGALFKSDTVLL